MRKVLAIIALLCAFAAPATAVDYPQLDGRVVDEARLLSDGAKRALENKLANLEAHASKQLIVVTLSSARGMTVDDYGLALQSQLEGTENRISVARRDYIEAVQAYNTELKTFPGVLWASTFYKGNKPMETFTIAEETKRPPQVKF